MGNILFFLTNAHSLLITLSTLSLFKTNSTLTMKDFGLTTLEQYIITAYILQHIGFGNKNQC